MLKNISNLGDAALYCDFGIQVNKATNLEVIKYFNTIREKKIKGINTNPLDYGNIPGCTYCKPEVASVGLTEKQAIENGFDIKVGKFPFTASGKAQSSGTSDGFVKVIFDSKYGEWLGCHMIGNNVTEMISEAVVGRKLETTGHEILKTVHPHPTLSEAVMEAVADAYEEVIHL